MARTATNNGRARAGQTSPKISAKQVRYLQAFRRRLGVTDELWGEMKASVGVASTLDLNQRQFNELNARLANGATEDGRRRTDDRGPKRNPSAGWRSRHQSASRSGMDKSVAEEQEPLLQKLEAMLAAMSLPWSYADGIARNVCRVDKVRWCNAGQLYKVVQVMAVYQRRKSGTRKSQRTDDR